MLNEKTSKTEKIIHIMVTSLCGRDCQHCCNKQYDLNSIPYVTDEELGNAHTICITGGEPFLFANPPEIARYYKNLYKNIKKIFVYTNAKELRDYLINNPYVDMSWIDGVDVSVKSFTDFSAFGEIVDDERIRNMSGNRLYLFMKTIILPSDDVSAHFDVIDRKWQVDFKPADDSIFRRA